MQNNKKENFSFGNESQRQVSSRQVSSRLSFRQAIEKAKEQINIECFNLPDRAMVQEIISNIAEVYMLYDSAPVKIAGDTLDGYIVKQVFEEIREEHVQLVIENYQRITYIVNYKKSYIRTALYNAVFEIEAHYTNLVNHDLNGV